MMVLGSSKDYLRNACLITVSILLVMDDGLGAKGMAVVGDPIGVSILLVMDDGLGV